MGRAISGGAIVQVLEEAVAAGRVPHVGAVVADRDGILYEGGAGVRIAGESDDPVTTSTQFRIMPMTKMVCTAAALPQMERGELDLDAPVDSYCPEFASVQVLEGFDGDTPRLRAPAHDCALVAASPSGIGLPARIDHLHQFPSAPPSWRSSCARRLAPPPCWPTPTAPSSGSSRTCPTTPPCLTSIPLAR